MIKILKVIFLNVTVIIMVTKSMTPDDNVEKACVTLVKKTIFMYYTYINAQLHIQTFNFNY